MFLKVVSGKRESIYECDNVHLDRDSDYAEGNVVVNIVGRQDRSFEFEKAKTTLYILNSDGDTIESYRWNQKVKGGQDGK